jgi:hypothetical protein
MLSVLRSFRGKAKPKLPDGVRIYGRQPLAGRMIWHSNPISLYADRRLAAGNSACSGACLGLIAQRRRFQVWKSGQHGGLQELKMRDRDSQFPEATLPIGTFDFEKILMEAVKSFALQVFVGSISHGYSGARQDVIDPPIKARMFLFCRIQSTFDCHQNRSHA